MPYDWEKENEYEQDCYWEAEDYRYSHPAGRHAAGCERKNSRCKEKKDIRITLYRFLTLILLVLLAVSFAANVIGRAEKKLGRNQLTVLEPQVRRTDSEGNAQLPDISQEFLSLNAYSRPGTPLESVNGIVVHYVGNPGTTAEQNRNYFESLSRSGETSASSHFVVGLDGEVVQCVPLNEVAYCSNDRNSDTISVECCHPDEEGKFTEETREALVLLLAELCRQYDLGSEDIIRHYDVTGKMCPIYYVDHEDAWESIRSDVAKELNR